MNYFTCDVKLNWDLQEKLCNKCPGGNSFETAVIVILLAISGFTSNDRAPGGPVTFWWPMLGSEIAKTAKCANLTKMCQNCQKGAKLKKSQNHQKQPLSGLSQVFGKECVSECSVSARVSTQGPDRPRSLVQPSPAFSS